MTSKDHLSLVNPAENPARTLAGHLTEPASPPRSLAQFIQQRREARDLTQRQLAARTHLSVEQIHDIETGIEPFLSPLVRSRLARVLRVKSSEIQAFEVVPALSEWSGDPSEGTLATRRRWAANLLAAMARDPGALQSCPLCQSPLSVQQYERRDLNNEVLDVLKAHCTQCLFRFTSD
ncbi:MAG: multiprotein-bridging factor 1 family protein [Candidatus Melainabacteria bacterium]